MSAPIPIKQLPSETYLPAYANKEKIYTRRIRGFYQRLRRNIATPLLVSFFSLPWLRIDERPAVLLDLSTQKFHIFWMTFWPQDGLLLAWLLIISALALFTITVWVGRVWCGFSCPQTIWTQLFIWLEDKCEGDRLQRIKLDARDWDTEKVLRKSSKHLLWLLLALSTSFTFIGYFYGIDELFTDIISLTIGIEALFWLGLFTLLTYLNAGWMREQVCKHMCPYARFQAVMYDSQTQVVAYDTARGDSLVSTSSGAILNKNTLDTEVLNNTEAISTKRIPRSVKTDHKAEGLGDCIDCSWCVQVCPVDIDIRDGMQANCINCGLCVDACDSIMDHMNYKRGLIRFASEDELNNPLKHSQKPFLPSPRLTAYGLVLFVIIGLFTTQLLNRKSLDVSIMRDRGVHLYRKRNGNIENVYLLRLGNMSRKTQRYQVSVLPPFALKGLKQVLLEEGEVLNLPLRAILKGSEVKQAQQSIVFRIYSLTDNSITIDKVASFISPSPK